MEGRLVMLCIRLFSHPLASSASFVRLATLCWIVAVRSCGLSVCSHMHIAAASSLSVDQPSCLRRDLR